MAFSAYALLILFSRFFLGGLPDRMRPAFTFYGGLVSMAVGLALLSRGPPPVLAIAAAALLGLRFFLSLVVGHFDGSAPNSRR